MTLKFTLKTVYGFGVILKSVDQYHGHLVPGLVQIHTLKDLKYFRVRGRLN